MRVVVSGAGGFIGAAVVRRLLAAGHSVAALVRPAADLRRLDPFRQRIEVLTEGLDDFAPEAAIHCAWDGVVGGSREDPARQAASYSATLAFLDRCRAAGVQSWIGLGSQAEYGPVTTRIAEDGPLRPDTVYGVTKRAAGEAAAIVCRRAKIRFAWARVFAVYGPGDSPAFLVPSLIARLLKGEVPALTLGTQVFDLLHVDDAAAALVLLAEDGRLSGVFNVGSGEPRTVRSIAEDIRDAVDPSLALGFGQIPMPPGNRSHLEADIARLAAAGWTPKVAWRDGLAATIAWHRQEART